MPTCHRYYPGRSDEACPLVYLHRRRPSLCNSQVGSCNCCFGACSAFTHVMACTLAESPSDPLHRKLRQLRCLRRRFDCYRVERTSSRAGVAPDEVQRLSRRTITPTDLTILNPALYSACLAGGGGCNGIRVGGIGPPNRSVSNILNASTYCSTLRFFPQRQSASWTCKRSSTPVMPLPGVRGLTTFALRPSMDFLVMI
jgi:hypothetical protein